MRSAECRLLVGRPLVTYAARLLVSFHIAAIKKFNAQRLANITLEVKSVCCQHSSSIL